MKKFLIGTIAAALFSVSAQAATVAYQVTSVKIGNQYTAGGGGYAPDATALNPAGYLSYDTVTQVLTGWQRHQSNASQAKYWYQADWSVDLSVNQNTTANTQCIDLGGTFGGGCASFSNGLSGTAISLSAGNLGITTNGNLISLKWLQPGAPGGNFITTNLTSIPVPAAVWLFGSALGLMGIARRRAA